MAPMPQVPRWVGPALLAYAATSVSGQCTPQWSAYSGPQLDNGVYCVTTWDSDGFGPAPQVVVAGGNFEFAGSVPLRFVGQYDGSA